MPIKEQPASEPARITVVASEACHFCEDAHRVLAELSTTHPMTVDIVDVRSEAGQRLMQVHRASMSPLVLLDGEFFSHGRLPRRKLSKILGQRQAGVAGSGAPPASPPAHRSSTACTAPTS